MNVVAKTKPFHRRKPPLLSQATSSPETFVRYVTAQAHAQLVRVDPLAIANTRWPADKSVRDIIRAVSEPPADLSNTRALAVVATDFVTSLQPISAAAQVMSAGLLLSFERNARIVLPDFTALDELPTPFVGAGQPAPVAEMASQALSLEPYKIELIITATKEMILSGNAERLIGDALKRSAAFALDKVLFDDQPGDVTRPPGLRSYSARLAESTALSNEAAMMMDIGSLVSANEHVAAAAPFFFIARSRRISAMRQMMRQTPPNFVLLPSAAGQALPESVLLCIVPLAFASAVGLPEVELVESATVEMDDTPGSSDLVQAQRVRSMFQSDTLGLKLRIPASWALRSPDAANWITCLWPSDVGAGGEGLPEAPFDEFTYGRHQSAWSPVCEEPPATPPSTAYVRASFGAPGGWHQLDPLLAHLAPLTSPAFSGNPTAPTPPPNDSSANLATTQFVANAVGEGGGGGIEEVPTDNGAYARVRSGAGARWMDFNTLRVASLDNPVFAAGNASTMGVGIGDQAAGATGFYRSGAGASSAVIFSVNATIPVQLMSSLAAFFVPVNVPDPSADGDALNRRFGDARYLQRSGGQLTGTLISAMGASTTNLGLAVGDNATGFYRDAATLVVSVSGDRAMDFSANRTAVLYHQLNVNGQRIVVVADATDDYDALNRHSGDARYVRTIGGRMTGALALDYNPVLGADAVHKAYVDQAASPRAPSYLNTPNSVTAAPRPPPPAEPTWAQLWTGNFDVQRAGNSRILVSVALNIRQTGSGGQVTVIGVRCQTAAATFFERHNFAYGMTNGAGGVSAQFFVDVNQAIQPLTLYVGTIDGTVGFTTIADGDAASQILIVDLGPR